MLVLDASVAINLLGSGKPEQLLRALDRRVLMADMALAEVRRDPWTSQSALPVLNGLRSTGLLTSISLDDFAYSSFLELTGAAAPSDMGDGEAATIAYAQYIGAVACLDDAKAIRIASLRYPGAQILHTLDLYACPSIRAHIPTEEVADLVFNALRTARMRVPRIFQAWVVELIGETRAKKCPSLGKLGLGSLTRQQAHPV